MGLALLLPPASGGSRATDLPTWVSTTQGRAPSQGQGDDGLGDTLGSLSSPEPPGPCGSHSGYGSGGPCPVASSEPGVQVARNQHGRAHQDSGSREQPLPSVATVRASPPTLSMAVQKESEGADPVARLRAGRLEPKQWVRGQGEGRAGKRASREENFCLQGVLT